MATGRVGIDEGGKNVRRLRDLEEENYYIMNNSPALLQSYVPSLNCCVALKNDNDTRRISGHVSGDFSRLTPELAVLCIIPSLFPGAGYFRQLAGSEIEQSRNLIWRRCISTWYAVIWWTRIE